MSDFLNLNLLTQALKDGFAMIETKLDTIIEELMEANSK